MKKKSIKVSKNVQNIKKRQKSIKALKKYLTPFRKSYAVIETNVRPRLKLMPKPKSLISKLEAIHKEMRKLFLKSKQTNISKKTRKINKILLDKKIIKKEKLVRILYLKDKTGLKTGLTKFVKKLTKIRFIQKTPEKRKISLRLRIRETIRKKKIKRQLRYGKYRRYHKYHKKNKYQGKKSQQKNGNEKKN